MKYMKSIRLLLATGFCVTAFSAPLAGQADASSRGPDSAAVDTVAVRDSAALADSAATPATGLVGDSAVSDSAVSDSAASDSAASDSAVTDTAVSDTAVSDTAVSDTAVSDTAVSDTAVSDTALSDTAASDAAVSDTAVSDAAVSDTASGHSATARSGADQPAPNGAASSAGTTGDSVANAAAESGAAGADAAGAPDGPGLLGAELPGPATTRVRSAASSPAEEDSDDAAATDQPVDPVESDPSAAAGQADSTAPVGPVERGSVAGRAVRGEMGSAPLGVEAPERRARPLGTSYTTLSDMRAVFAPRASEPGLEPEPVEEVEPDTTLAAVAQRFRPRAGEPIGLPTDPEEAARVSRANAPLMPALGTAWGEAGPGFVQDQLRFDRVLDARLDSRFRLRALFREQGLSYPPRELFIRIFKQEQLLEVWVRDGAEPDAAHQLLKRYEICAVSGRLGPKRRFQDFQAPEGFYYIEGFNPQSDFHLSLRLNYPNPADRLLGMPEQLGGDIYIHGGCATAGCFPVTDAAIKELYWLAVEARGAGQEVIPVHVFPTRMTDDRMRWLRSVFRADRATIDFWNNLREGYDYFERTRTLPHVMIDGLGRYRISEPAATDSTAAAAAG